MLNITGISNETRNKSTIYATLYQNVAIFYRQQLAFLFQVQVKLKECRNSKCNFSKSCLIADETHVKIARLHVVVFTEHGDLYLLKRYPEKIPQKRFKFF